MTEDGDAKLERAATTVSDADATNAGRPSIEPVPTKVGRYRVLYPLGKGGMGVVYRALDPKLNRDVAIKVVKPSRHSTSRETQARTVREAQALARLSHPNVVEVFDVGMHGAQLFIAMELLEGRTFASMLHGDTAWHEWLEHYLAAGRAVAAAHAADLVHRDFKPHNVMLTEAGEVKVLDFGLARMVAEPVDPASDTADSDDAPEAAASAFDFVLTTTGTVVGTPAYMAPEQFNHERIDDKADQFSFCVALWEALYGTRPFRASNLHDLRETITRQQPRLPKQTEVPARVAEILRVGLREDPGERYASMSVLLAQLQTVSLPSGRLWLGLVGISAVAAIGLTTWLATTPAQPCQGGRTAIERTWSAPRRTEVQHTVLGSGRAFATSTWRHLGPRLDQWATDWTDSHETICRATAVEQTQTSAQLDLRMACLERSRAAMDAYLAVLLEGKAGALRRAVTTAARLPPPSQCVQSQAGEHAERALAPAIASRAKRLRVRLHEAAARGDAGELTFAIQSALAVRAEATDLAVPTLVADALLLEADQRDALGEAAAAEAALREAYLLAIGEDDAVRAAKASRALVFVAGVELGRYDDAVEWHRHARAQLDRSPADPLAEAALLSALGALQGRHGHHAAATKSQLQALELERGALGDDDIRSIATYSNLATALVNEQRAEQAVAYAQHAVDIARDNLGEDHPDLIATLEILAGAHAASGRSALAANDAEQAVTIAQNAYGEDHVITGRALQSHAKIRATAGEHAAAIVGYQRALTILRNALGPTHTDVVAVSDALARSLFAEGQLPEAIALMRAALVTDEQRVGAEHPELGRRWANLATAERRAGHRDEALTAYGRALSILEGAEQRDTTVATTHHNFALALHDAQRWSDAEHHDERAAAILRESGDTTSATYVAALSGRATALLRLQRHDEAATLFETALNTVKTDESDAMLAVGAQVFLRAAEAAAARGDQGRVVALARSAQRRYDALGDAAGRDAATALLDDGPD